jgi:hypothetical protein
MRHEEFMKQRGLDEYGHYGENNPPSAAAAQDIIKQPSHYTRYSIQPKTFIMANGLEFWRGNIVKYAMRAGFKSYPNMDAVQSEITDLEKIKEYADIRIEYLKGEQDNGSE